MPGTVLSFTDINSLKRHTNPMSRYNHYPHFIDDEIETQRG